MRTASFAGVERYLTYLGPEQVRQGLDVTIIGGEPVRMAAALDGSGVSHLPSGSVSDDLRRVVATDPSIVHSHMTDADLVAVAARARHRRPVVSTLHFAKPRGRDAARRVLLAPLPKLMASQIAISRFVAAHADVPDAVVIPNGVPWTYEEAPREEVVLVAQRLEPEKATDVAIRAWAASGLADHGWRMVLAGSGSQRGHLERLAADFGVRTSLDLVGAVDDIAHRQARCGIFLATAPAEPFGLAVVEAMAAGSPIVAAAGGAHAETVGSAGTDRLFPPGDADAAADLLRRLAQDPGERWAHGASLRAEYLRSFTIERHTERVVGTYHHVLGGRS